MQEKYRFAIDKQPKVAYIWLYNLWFYMKGGGDNLKNLRFLRERANISVKALAEGMGVTPQAVGKWERGESSPRSEQLPNLADLIGCTIDDLFGRDTQDTA